MNLRISGKHMEIGEAFHRRIEERISEAMQKYFDGGFSGRVTVEKSRGRFSAGCTIHLDTGAVLQAAGEAQDPQLAFDDAAGHMEKRLRRYKRKLKSHSSYQKGQDLQEAAVVAESRLAVRSMSVASATLELEMKESRCSHSAIRAATRSISSIGGRTEISAGSIPQWRTGKAMPPAPPRTRHGQQRTG